jgi:hypothetical protein
LLAIVHLFSSLPKQSIAYPDVASSDYPRPAESVFLFCALLNSTTLRTVKLADVDPRSDH